MLGKLVKQGLKFAELEYYDCLYEVAQDIADFFNNRIKPGRVCVILCNNDYDEAIMEIINKLDPMNI